MGLGKKALGDVLGIVGALSATAGFSSSSSLATYPCMCMSVNEENSPVPTGKGKESEVYLALPRGAQWRPVSSVEISIGDPLEAAGR